MLLCAMLLCLTGTAAAVVSVLYIVFNFLTQSSLFAGRFFMMHVNSLHD